MNRALRPKAPKRRKTLGGVSSVPGNFYARVLGERGPARRVVTGRRTGAFTGTFPSRKMGQLVAFESLLEADLIALLEVSPDVLRFHAQPETIRWREPTGRLRRYTPDFLVETAREGRVYREVKPRRRLLKDPTLGGRRARIVAECAERGGQFEVWTEVEIRAEPRAANVRAILAAGRSARDKLAEAVIMRALYHLGRTTLDELARETGFRLERLVLTVHQLTALGVIGVDLDRALPDGAIWLRRQP